MGMLCQVCKTKNAAVHFKQVCDGAAQELYLCETCAAQKGFAVEAPLGLTDFLFGMGTPKSEAKLPGEDRACPACHMRRSDFRKTSRLGCPQCYDTFAGDLAPILDDMHQGSVHAGKVPSAATQVSRTAAFRKALDQAVAAQNFEEAARLRDQIRGASDEPPAEQTGGS